MIVVCGADAACSADAATDAADDDVSTLILVSLVSAVTNTNN